MADDPSLDDVLAQLRSQYGDSTPPDTTTADPSVAPDPAPAVVQPQAAPAPPSPYMVATATRESGNDPNAKNPNSSASGTNQFLDGTYQDMVNRHPDRNYQGKNDPRLMQDFTQENTQALRLGLGRAPTSMDIYAAHFLGATGAVKFLTAPPNTPVTQVVSPEAINSNHNVFFDKASGQPLTVGQVYNQISQNMGFKDTIPLNPQGGVAGRGPPQQIAAPAGAPVAAQTPGDALYGQQKQDIASYIAGQPAMWSKLADLQNQYKEAAKPTIDDKLADAMSQFQQQNSVAQAGMHATAGGVLNNALPNATDFNRALQASHTIDTDARTARLNQAQQAYQMDSGALQAKNTADAANLGLTGNLAKETGEYNLNSGTNALKLAQFNLDQQKGVNEQIEKLVPNPETRAVVSAMYDKAHNPNGGYQQNMQILNGIIQKVQTGTPGTPGSDAVTAQPALADPDAPGIAGAPAVAGKAAVPAVAAVPGMQISAKEPTKMMSITTFDPMANNGAGGQKQETVNAATPEGQARLKQVAISNPDAKITDLGAPQTNVSVGGAGEGGAGASKGAGNPAQQHMAAIQTGAAAKEALKLLPFLEQNGGTGILTDSDQGKAIANIVKQLTGIDQTGASAREVYSKLMKQIQTGQIGPMMAQMGPRPSQLEFQNLMAGQLGSTSNSASARSYLNHIIGTMDWQQRMIENQSDGALEAKRQNNTFYDPINAQIQWQKQPGNQPPVWNTDELTNPTDASPPAPKPLLSSSQTDQVIKWAKDRVGVPAVPPQASPAAPTTGFQKPISDEERKLLMGGQ